MDGDRQSSIQVSIEQVNAEIEAGKILLATNSTVFADHLEQLTKSEQRSLGEVMEQCRVAINGKQFYECATGVVAGADIKEKQ